MISTTEKTVHRSSFKTLIWLLPFLWVTDAKIRFGIVASVFFTVLLIFFNTCIPLLFKNIINCFAVDMTHDGAMIQILFISYGFAWTINQAGQQLSYMSVIPALERGMRTLNLRIFYHLHSLSMRFHLDKKTGAITNAIDRTQSGFDAIFWALFLFVIPTTIEMAIIIIVFTSLYGIMYSGILLCTALCYFLFCSFCMNILDTMQATYNQKKSLASELFVDSLLKH